MEKEQKNKGKLNGLTNAENETENKENSSNEQMIEREEIQGTPFHAIRTQGRCFGVFGRIKITEDFETMPEVHEKLFTFNWDATLAIVIGIAEAVAKETILQLQRAQTAQNKKAKEASTEANVEKNA